MLKGRFLEGMSRAAATVSVVTTGGKAGRSGVTVSAMTAVSADSDSPSLLVCINEKSATANAIRENRVFCVNVLGGEQTHISDVFAGRIRPASGNKFECADWSTLTSDAPVLNGALVAFDCTLKKAFLHATHWVFVGELNDIAIREGRAPLVYLNRQYGKPVLLASG